MVEILFPAKKIKPRSRLIIWGANTVGLCFYEQITSLGYADVIAFIDSKIKRCHLKAGIHRPEWLRENGREYDQILIGSVRKNVRDEIKQILLDDYHVPTDKIVCDGYMPYIKGSGIADMDSPDELVGMLSRFGDTEENALMSIEYIMEKARENNALTEVIRRLFHDAESVKTKLTCAYILFSIDRGDAILLKELYAQLSKCVRQYPIWVHYFIFNLLQSVIMWYPEYRYPQYYMERKGIMHEIAGTLYGKKQRVKPINRKRIAIACSAPLIGGQWHITKIVATVANGLKRKGYEVAVFIESKVYSPDEFFINTYFVDRRGLSVFEDSNKTAFDQGVSVFYTEGRCICEHTNDFMDKVIGYKPDGIIFFAADSTCAAAVLYDLFPITYIPTVIFNVCADSHCVMWGEPEQLLELDHRYPWKSERQTISRIHLMDIRFITKRLYKREDKGWKPDEFIAVTVGNRLKYDLKDGFVDTVCHEIKKNHRLKWVLVGISSVEYIDLHYEELVRRRKIEYISYEDDLTALYKIADVYLNPDRSGGGLSMACAMKAGVPVITLDTISDVVQWVGKENAVKGDYNSLVSELRRLESDRGYYVVKSQKMMEKSQSWSTERCIDSILAAMEKAAEIFGE